MIVSAGGYVSVPLVVLGRLMGCKSWVHQQDVVAGVANKVSGWFASRVSVTFEDSAPMFSQRKVAVTGNAVRASVANGSRERALRKFGLSEDRKTLLVLGGGGGSLWINRSVSAIADHLTESWQVLHVTGREKVESVKPATHHFVVEPLIGDGMADAYALADVVLCRAGMGTLTELATVGKPAIVIPIPNSHQEDNAFFLYEHQAALILDQTETTPQVLLSAIRTVIEDEDVMLRLSANLKLSFPKDGTKTIAEGVLELATQSAAKWQRPEQAVKEPEEVAVDAAPSLAATPVTEPAVSSAQEALAMESIEIQIRRALGGDSTPANKGEDEPFETHSMV
ncbi:UDP-N-acetylglucosamine--N-acetylmuramyl-(pentapeptide) pyrophosphoryl-undecaprenol N-acetylglucosamine transferase [Candidatus Uhrbacteria bacterium]|nr:UDP-N-acetylglucosamine--N-acetylmuramyl-(pentapeptide) pyrophosphoryl-undecaprenol N-acetylglucosamine transferase [Candidatus Uhrbacteria bacterium]